jgi:hypothetical protein
LTFNGREGAIIRELEIIVPINIKLSNIAKNTNSSIFSRVS